MPAQKQHVSEGACRQDECVLEMVGSREGTRVERRHSRHTTQHLAARLPLRATANPNFPSPEALPGAGFSGGRRGGAAGRRENSITLPAYAICLPAYAICLVPSLGQGLVKVKGSQAGWDNFTALRAGKGDPKKTHSKVLRQAQSPNVLLGNAAS